MSLKLDLRPPYDWEHLIGFLQSRAIPGVECVEDGNYLRTIRIHKQKGHLRVQRSPAGRHLHVSIDLPDTSQLKTVIERTRRLFDTDADSNAINLHLKQDPVLAKSIKKHPGLRVPGAWEPFEIAVRAVLGQQVSVAAARTFAARLVQAFGEPLKKPSSDGLKYLFPTAEVLAEADLTAIGLTHRRAQTLQDLSRAFTEGSLELDKASDLDDIQERLCTLPGIGPWTAQYIAMRAFGEPDAFPTGDLGLLNAFKAMGEEISIRDLDQRAQNWRPWRAYATMHLWTMCPPKPRKSKK